jgi:hypothetical protein
MELVNLAGCLASAQRRAMIVCAALAVCIGVDIFSALSTIGQIALLHRIVEGAQDLSVEAKSNDARQAVLAVLKALTYLATAATFLVWFHRAYRILPSLGATQLGYSPGKRCGKFFRSFRNFVRPFRVMSEIWRASDPSVDNGWSWIGLKTPVLPRFWWGLFLLDNLVGSISAKASESGASVTG